jgi:hypothetical protein
MPKKGLTSGQIPAKPRHTEVSIAQGKSIVVAGRR